VLDTRYPRSSTPAQYLPERQELAQKKDSASVIFEADGTTSKAEIH
jgi:hypothetical protein